MRALLIFLYDDLDHSQHLMGSKLDQDPYFDIFSLSSKQQYLRNIANKLKDTQQTKNGHENNTSLEELKI